MLESLSYWVFTSGEKGIHELDWGVKYASPVFTDRLGLDVRYRALLKDFSLPPSLRRPNSGAGVLLIPWEEGTALGFIFSGNDHQGRPNTSAIVCVIPENLSRELSVDEVIRCLWKSNDLERIALRGGGDRPETLSFDEENTQTPPPALTTDVNWPSNDRGWLQVDGIAMPLTRIVPQEVIEEYEKPRPRKRMPILAAAVVLGFVVVFSLKYVLPDGSRENSSAQQGPAEREQEATPVSNSQGGGTAPEPPIPPEKDPERARREREERKRKKEERKRQEEEARKEAERKRREREEQEKAERERREREEQEMEELKRKVEESRKDKERKRQEEKARQEEEAARKELRGKAESAWKSLGLNDAYAGALVDIILTGHDGQKYGKPFKSVMSVSGIKDKIKKMIGKGSVAVTGGKAIVSGVSAQDWEDFQTHWQDATVFSAEKLSPAAGRENQTLEDIYKKLEEILSTDKSSVGIMFIFNTAEEGLYLALQKTIPSVRNPERQILTRNEDLIETDPRLFDGVKRVGNAIIGFDQMDKRLAELFDVK